MANEKPNNTISEEKELKFVVVGEEGSGKTNLINAFIEIPFEENKPTQLIDFKRIAVKRGNRVLKIRFWDTPRQVSFFGPTPYYRGADLIFLVVDGSLKFDEKRAIELLNYIQRDNPNPTLPIIVVMAKSDIAISKKEIASFALKENFPFYSTSSLKRDGIEELFLSSIELTLSRPVETNTQIRPTKPKEKCQ